MPQTISVRGANGLNLFVISSEPADPADLVSCQNIDLSVERAILPRRGLGRPDSWSGLVFCDSGDLFKDEFGVNLTGGIASFCAATSIFRSGPTVAT